MTLVVLLVFRQSSDGELSHALYFSVRDWARFCYVVGSIRIHHPHVIGFVVHFFFPLWKADSKISGFAAEFSGCVWTKAVSGKNKLRIQKYSDPYELGPKHRLSLTKFVHELFFSPAMQVCPYCEI